jgi:hypothetical protein
VHIHACLSDPARFHVLCAGCVIAPPKAPKRRTQDPVFAKKLQALRRLQDEREYQAVVAELASSKSERSGGLGGGMSMRSIGKVSDMNLRQDLGVGLNVIALMATGFVLFYVVGRQLFGGGLMVGDVIAYLCCVSLRSI